MRLAYVITLFKQPEQFGRLLNAIWHPDDTFALHVDAKTPPDIRRRFEAVVAGRPNVAFVDPVRVTWGGFSLCEAEWRALGHLLKHGGQWDYVMNVTGQDFPLMGRNEILAELSRVPGANYMQIRDVSNLPRHFRRRSQWFCLEARDRLWRLPIPYPPPRRFRNQWYGVGWYILTRDFCEWLAGTPLMEDCRRYFRHVKHPHEAWLQAMMMESPFRDTVIRDNRRAIRWTHGSGNPNILTCADLPLLEGSNAFFARKFDETVDAEILKVLEERLQVEPSRLPLVVAH
ncbi:MAG TPA: beta-1,6-N-acetylglucosaminyltransferase [Arenibaculum sp.]|nr:beta-1,6-N-acetylglucosaminyltransferase [Arenibaculum sp.]